MVLYKMYIPSDNNSLNDDPLTNGVLCNRRHNNLDVEYVNCMHEAPLEIAVKTVGKWYRIRECIIIVLFDEPHSIISVLFLIMLIGICGNLSIIIIITKNKLLRQQVTNLFLLNMALADITNLIFNPILYFFRNEVIFSNYMLGETLCRLSPAFLGNCIY